MQNELFIAIIAGLGGMLGWGFADFFAKKTIDEIGDLTTLFWAQLIGILPLTIFFLFNHNFNLNDLDLTFLILFGIVSAISYDILYKAFGKGEVSIISPIFASNAGLVVILSAFLFGEIIPTLRWLALVIIILGILATCINPKGIIKSIKKDVKKGLPEVIIALVVFSFWLVSWSNFISNKSWLLILFVRVIATITVFVMARIRGIDLKVRNKKLWIFLALIGIFDTLAFSLVSVGFSLTRFVSVVAVLSGAFSLPTIILARIFLKEKLSKIQSAGAFAIILGIIFLSLN